jgi:hypothetical protein
MFTNLDLEVVDCGAAVVTTFAASPAPYLLVD